MRMYNRYGWVYCSWRQKIQPGLAIAAIRIGLIYNVCGSADV